jgi:hypothetical protein
MTGLYANGTQWFIFVILPVTIGLAGWLIAWLYTRNLPLDGEPDRKN